MINNVHNLIQINKVLVLKTKYGTDKIIIYIDRPHPFNKNAQATMKLDAPCCEGEKYCQQNFKNVPIEVIEV